MITSAFFITVVLLYAVFVLYLWWHWRHLSAPVISNSTEELSISILIPFRNEGNHLPHLIDHLNKQIVPSHILWEVLLINDHSTDGYELEVPSSQSFSIRVLSNSGEGKKAAITMGAAAAKGELLITLDADVRIGTNWLSTIAGVYQHKKAALYILPVMLEPSRSVFGQMQELEFCSLMGTTLAMAQSGQPIMCNGANLAFQKKAFESLGGYQMGKSLASGDDLFLLFAVKKHSTMTIEYAALSEATAYTEGARSLSEFLSQRIRWGGKSRHYSDLPALWTAALVLLVNLVLVASLICAGLGIISWISASIIWAIKFIPDLLFLGIVASWFNRRSILWTSPLVLIVYPMYIVIAGLAGFFWKPGWKGRRI
jgi:poly-beta-1,6-N-acetyl-D-glucosamine synthase